MIEVKMNSIWLKIRTCGKNRDLLWKQEAFNDCLPYEKKLYYCGVETIRLFPFSHCLHRFAYSTIALLCELL